jgi:hypothetical protein
MIGNHMIAVLLILLGLLLGYEFYALKQHQGYTISETFWHLAYRYPLVPFAFGLLSGHFVWQSAKCAELLK